MTTPTMTTAATTTAGTPDDLVQALRHAAAQAMDSAAAAAPVLLPACKALRTALDGVAQAWAGSWVPGVGNLYQRALQPLPRAEAFARVPPALMESCCVYLPQQVHDAVWQAAGKPDMQALQAASSTAAGHFVQALCSLHLLLERAVAERGDNGEIADLLVAASQVSLADKDSIAASWRLQQGGRPRQPGPFATTPAHVTQRAAVDSLSSPLDGLLQVAGLLRRAVLHLEGLHPAAGLGADAATAWSASVPGYAGQGPAIQPQADTGHQVH